MEYESLGTTGMKVSRLCLGTMMFGQWGNPDHDEGVRIIHAALDAGINFIDTANVYSRGESEEIVGKALKGRRDGVVLATKVHGRMGDGPLDQGNSRRHIMLQVESSLGRLGTDWIDLYQIHRPDPGTSIEETLGALSDLVHQGKVRSIGSSTFPASMIVEAQWAAERRGLERFVCEQPPYSIMVRGIEADVLPTCRRYGMGVIVWSPLAGGWLSGKYRRNEPAPAGGRVERVPQYYDPKREENAYKLDLVEKLAPIVDKSGTTMARLAVAWTLLHPAVTSAIIGPRTMEHLTDILPAAEVVLEDAILDEIDAISPPGAYLNHRDVGWDPPWLLPAVRRRA
jgi:aryl-alcohol dehydrogenase-like predicted oxidoreductase